MGHSLKHTLITTTINVPNNLEAYAKDAKAHGHNLTIIVAGDQKTPPETESLCNLIAEENGIECIYMGPPEQERFLSHWPMYRDFLPWNCIQRRNVALLNAYTLGADIIVTIDDDNFFVSGKDYFGQHGPLGKEEKLPCLASSRGWFNICELLSSHPGIVYHRGFSFKARSAKRHQTEHKTRIGRAVVNAGLWTGDPDVDAVTRLSYDPEIVSTLLGTNNIPARYALAHDTKTPFNSQNTALHRDVIPAYCMMVGVGRYDDIIPGYFVKRIADHLGDYITFGQPIVHQKRNAHDVFKDLEDEMVGMQLIDRIVAWLYEIHLTQKTYKECLSELLPEFVKKFAADNTLTFEQRSFLNAIEKNYMLWLECFA